MSLEKTLQEQIKKEIKKVVYISQKDNVKPIEARYNHSSSIYPTLPVFSEKKEISYLDFIDFNKTTKNNDFIRTIVVGSQNSDIKDGLKITVAIDLSPQPLSPEKPFIYSPKKPNGTLGETSYIIFPCEAIMRVFISHEGYLDKIKIYEAYSDTKKDITDKFKVINDYWVYEKDDRIAVRGYSEEPFNSYNKTHGFIKKATQEGNYVIYKTSILSYVLPPSQTEKTIRFIIECEDQICEFKHEYKPQGFYPSDYSFYVNLMEDYNVDPNIDNNFNGFDLLWKIQFKDYGETKEFKTYKIGGKTQTNTYKLTPVAVEKKETLG